jgi:hypothetical protein
MIKKVLCEKNHYSALKKNSFSLILIPLFERYLNYQRSKKNANFKKLRYRMIMIRFFLLFTNMTFQMSTVCTKSLEEGLIN